VTIIALPSLFRTLKYMAKYLLSCCGFTGDGVAGDSMASRYQSRHFGGYVPADSVFSDLQSRGATYDDLDDEPCCTCSACYVIVLFICAAVGAILGTLYFNESYFPCFYQIEHVTAAGTNSTICLI
jgi:hypothetical protein